MWKGGRCWSSDFRWRWPVNRNRDDESKNGPSPEAKVTIHGICWVGVSRDSDATLGTLGTYTALSHMDHARCCVTKWWMMERSVSPLQRPWARSCQCSCNNIGPIPKMNRPRVPRSQFPNSHPNQNRHNRQWQIRNKKSAVVSVLRKWHAVRSKQESASMYILGNSVPPHAIRIRISISE